MRAIPKMADYLDPDNDSDNAIFEARGKLIIALQQWAVEADLDIKKFISKYQTERRKNKQLQAEVEGLRSDIGQIKIIMNNEFIEGTEEFYHWAFYDEELTKINWIKQALLNKER